MLKTLGLTLVGILCLLIGLSAAMTCTMSDPPQCGGPIAASPFWIFAGISFYYAFFGRTKNSEEGD